MNRHVTSRTRFALPINVSYIQNWKRSPIGLRNSDTISSCRFRSHRQDKIYAQADLRTPRLAAEDNLFSLISQPVVRSFDQHTSLRDKIRRITQTSVFSLFPNKIWILRIYVIMRQTLSNTIELYRNLNMNSIKLFLTYGLLKRDDSHSWLVSREYP